jgi:hypothetical protein
VYEYGVAAGPASGQRTAISAFGKGPTSAKIRQDRYLLYSDVPHRLCFLRLRPRVSMKNPIQGHWIDRHSLLRESIEEFAAAL